jgi:hypothetical protein
MSNGVKSVPWGEKLPTRFLREGGRPRPWLVDPSGHLCPSKADCRMIAFICAAELAAKTCIVTRVLYDRYVNTFASEQFAPHGHVATGNCRRITFQHVKMRLLVDAREPDIEDLLADA